MKAVTQVFDAIGEIVCAGFASYHVATGNWDAASAYILAALWFGRGQLVRSAVKYYLEQVRGADNE